MGTPGVLAGHACRVVGYVRRAEAQNPQYEWTEYQLFRPATGDYVQLAQYHGHWMVIWAAQDKEWAHDGETDFQLAKFRLYNRYQARVCFAEGEFDWDIEGDDYLIVSELINPPLMLVKEQLGKQVSWHRAEHVEPADVAAAFGRGEFTMPEPQGIGAVQPNPTRHTLPALWHLTLWVVGLLVLAQIGLAVQPSTVLLNTNLAVEADPAAAVGTNKVIVSPSFMLDYPSAVEVDLTASLTNQWLELPVSLVNERTGQGFEFTKNIEFYNGVEDGESWSEGERDASALLSRVPAGRYHLNLYPFTETGTAPTISVAVRTDRTLPSNFFIVLLLVLIYPAWIGFRGANFETERWNESDYNPYAVETGTE
ncbi:DUF4178 domain-containing protein [Hymenobacter sp. PAMC 26628]|uniref:DUF4178 domain-containing protein n=1 Tax=Hymenobacter sp. PAMC 26628 TaxID=1484118 RepID=UPI0012FFA0F5|nr:DUF4178 domain-containing protein [Hymenobacter sp. PAMC 26628]